MTVTETSNKTRLPGIIKRLLIGCFLAFGICMSACPQEKCNVKQDIYQLQQGYELCVFLSPDSIRRFILKYGHETLLIEEEPLECTRADKYALRYSGMDFEKYFVLDRWESQYTVRLYLYEKSTGKNLFKNKLYYRSGYDAPSDLLLYQDADDKSNPDGNLTLLDLQTLSETEIDIRQFIPKGESPVYYQANFEISKVTGDSVYITYHTEEPVSHPYLLYKRERTEVTENK